MVMRGALLAATLSGCNWVLGLDAVGAQGDVDATDAVEIDAPLGPWGERQPVAGLAVPGLGEEDPSMEADGSVLYSTLRTPMGTTGVDVRVSPAEAGGTWGAPAFLQAVNSASDDANPRISYDELRLYVASARPGGGGGLTDVWVSARNTPADAWQLPAPLGDPQVNGATTDRTLTECADGHRIFLSDRLGSFDVFEEVGGVATPIAAAGMPVINESTPFITRDCLTLYFSKDGAPTLDLWVATRTTPGDEFGTAVMIEELSRPDTHDSDPWVSPDGHHMVFSVAPLADPGGTDVYESTR